MLMKPKQDGGAVYMSNGGRVSEGPVKGEVNQEIDEQVVAAEELMAAIERKDVQAVKDSLKSFIEMCNSEEYE